MAERSKGKKLTGKPGTAFEEFVERQYRQLGATKVARNVNIGGHEIDVFAELPSLDGTVNRVIVSCKDLAKPAGVDLVREWSRVFSPLREQGKVDVAVIVSAKGFTQDAHAAAEGMGIKLISRDSLSWAGCNFTSYLETLMGQVGQDPVFLENRYIPMTLSFERKSEELSIEAMLSAFINDEPAHLLTILGDYGAGKTTLMRKVFLDHAKSFLKGEDSRLPILVNLKDYPKHLNFSSFLTDLLVNEYGARCPNYSVLRSLSREGKILFLFDAFDEMATRSSQAITLQNFQAMRSLFDGKAKIVLTCRTHYFKSRAEMQDTHDSTELFNISRGKSYRFAYLSPLKWDQIQSYIKAASGANWERDLDAIRNTYNLTALAEKPILLQMMTEVVPLLTKEGKRIDSTALYAEYTDLWLKRDDWRVSLSRQDRLRFTMALAESMYQKGALSFNWEEVEAAILRRWPRESRQEIEHYQFDVRTCTFIKRDAKDKYTFVHQSFMEYFVAARLYESIVEDNTYLMRLREHSKEVVDFLGGHICTEQVRKTITEWYAQCGTDAVFLLNLLECSRRWNINVIGLRLVRYHAPLLNLSGLICEGVQLRKIEVDSLTLTKGRWQDVVIEEAKCKGIVFDETEVSRLAITGCSGGEISARESRLSAVTVRNCAFKVLRANKVRCNNWMFADEAVVKVIATDSDFVGCDFMRAVLAGSRFIGGTIAGAWWGRQALDGVTFEKVTFTDGGEGLVRSLGRTKDVHWSVKPVLISPQGIEPSTLEQLKVLGVIIRDAHETAEPLSEEFYDRRD